MCFSNSWLNVCFSCFFVSDFCFCKLRLVNVSCFSFSVFCFALHVCGLHFAFECLGHLCLQLPLSLCSLTGDARTFVFTVSVCLLCFFLLAVARFVLLFCFSAFCLPAFWFCSMSYLENIIRLAFLSLFILGLVLIVFTSWFHCICMCFAFCICFLFLMSFLFSCCSMIQPALTLPSFSSACSTNLER